MAHNHHDRDRTTLDYIRPGSEERAQWTQS